MSIGGGTSGGSSRSRSSYQGQVWDQQAPFLGQLYGSAQQLATNQNPQEIGQAAGGLVNQIQQGQGAYAGAATNPAIANLMQRAGGDNPYINQQIQGLGADLGQFFNQQLLPGISSSAGQAGGQYGGSRMGIAQGMAAQDVTRQFTQGATNLRAGAYNQGGQAAAQAGALAGQSVGQGMDLYNLGMSPYMAQWMPLQNQAQITGGPTVLNSGNSSAGSWNAEGHFNMGFGGFG